MLSKLKIKYIQSLGQKKFRDEHGVFIAEGPRCIEEFIRSAAAQMLEVYATGEARKKFQSTAGNIPVVEISEEELERISRLNTPHQALAIIKKFPALAAPDPSARLVLALDGIQDPGNLGTIIRIADWFGIGDIVCGEGTAEIYNPKVVQATMGSLARISMHELDLDAWLDSHPDARVYACVMEGQDLRKLGTLRTGVILVGNESKGIRPSLIERANVRITIPRTGEAESLNAAVAAGIVLSHIC
jgi:TrmH family RNA methyltransferase